MYHYTDGGLRNVWLMNGYKIQKTPHGEGLSIDNLVGLTAAICLSLTAKQGPLTGVEFRYIRSAGMMLSQPLLGKLIGVDAQSVARWEKTGKVPKWADKFVRVVYTAHARGAEPVKTTIERIKTIDRIVKQKIVVSESKGQWAPASDSKNTSKPIKAKPPAKGASVTPSKLAIA